MNTRTDILGAADLAALRRYRLQVAPTPAQRTDNLVAAFRVFNTYRRAHGLLAILPTSPGALRDLAAFIDHQLASGPAQPPPNTMSRPKPRIHRPGYRYTLFIVSDGVDRHTPILVGPNGKPTLNEPCRRAAHVERAHFNLRRAYALAEVDTRRLSRKEFRALFPKFPRNAGRRA